MRIFISYSAQDRETAARLVDRLKMDGHDVWIDSLQIQPGDNFQSKIEQGLERADALIVIVSENSFKSPWVQREFAVIALQEISKRERRVIPVRIDKSPLPSYLADRLYLDLTEDFDGGLIRFSKALAPPIKEPASLKTVKRRIWLRGHHGFARRRRGGRGRDAFPSGAHLIEPRDGEAIRCRSNRDRPATPAGRSASRSITTRWTTSSSSSTSASSPSRGLLRSGLNPLGGQNPSYT
jgi:hypothetical protein